ncbi:hypothetical protein N7450_004999 [Penicillium hetheringtonii]|uniref:Uncharacterized protein n=1 Tax=Penicillium hetheringtonii TaxID=911720 RepID=A0AAD6DSJ2_9EURO|nr:hypothetical protein N7450_004999 [Penicillium hetheringtonii]
MLAGRGYSSSRGHPSCIVFRDSHVVTHHTTNLPACGLSTAERTGSPVLHTLWSYVLDVPHLGVYTFTLNAFEYHEYTVPFQPRTIGFQKRPRESPFFGPSM